MKVFLSWSGEMSRHLAEALRDWLPSVLQSVKPFFTPTDIEKGARWSKDISQELEQSTIGIFCLTKENLTKPWIMFEAGALSKNLDTSRVCPLLFGVDNADLQGPLVQFQASPFSEAEMRKLVRTLNAASGEQRLEDPVLSKVFDMWWPQLDSTVRSIYVKYENAPADQGSERSDREILEEVLQLTRLRSKRIERTTSPDLGALVFALRRLSEVPPAGTNPVSELIINVAEALEFFLTRCELSSKESTEVKMHMDTIKLQQKPGL